MIWIKRNLLLTAGGLVALALLGFGGWYVSQGLGENAELHAASESARTELNNIYTSPDPFPQQTNIAAAKAEAAKLTAAVGRSVKFFAPVPAEKVDQRSFLALRDNTLAELRRLATASGTRLPTPQYAFSFETQRQRTSFGAGTFPSVPEQLMEIKALSQILFEARVPLLGNIRRDRVSADDRASSNLSDYLGSAAMNQQIAAAQAESHPYELTFYCFSSELAQVLNSLERSKHGFIVKAIMVEPESSQMADAGGPNTAAAAEVGAPPGPGVRPPGTPRVDRFGRPTGANPPVRPVAPGVAAPRPGTPAGDKVVQVLKEKRLKITMLVYTIRSSK